MKEKSREKTVAILIYLFCIPMLGIMVLASLQSLLSTTYFELYQIVEVPYYKSDHPLILLLAAILLFAVLKILRKKTSIFSGDWWKMKNGYLVAAGSISLLFVLIFRGTATADSAGLSEFAVHFLAGDNSDMIERGYLCVYPFQLGIVALLQLIWFVFGNQNYIVFQLMNVAAIVSILYILNCITEELFADKMVTRCGEILSVCMLPLFLYATFVYGDIIGLAFGIGAIYYVIKFIKDNSYLNLLWASLLMAVAILLKSNNNVIMIAIVIILILKWLRYPKKTLKENLCLFAGIAGIVLLPSIFYRILALIYCAVYQIGEIPKGAPKILWIAMSLQEDAPFEYGWYNAYNWNTYIGSGLNQEIAKAAGLDSIKESLQNFISRPRFTLTFFYRKFISQWNAPCFQSLITNEWSSRHSENLSAIANTLLYGTGRRILAQLMNFYHFIMYLCVSAFLVKGIKKIRLEQALLVLCIFGGILFHLIWEAQARYALPYFILMLPLAAKGMEGIIKD